MLAVIAALIVGTMFGAIVIALVVDGGDDE